MRLAAEKGKRFKKKYEKLPYMHNIIFIKRPIFLLFYYATFAIYKTNTFKLKLIIQTLDHYGVQIYQRP